MFTIESEIAVFGSQAVDALSITSKSFIGRSLTLGLFEQFSEEGPVKDEELKMATILGMRGRQKGSLRYASGKDYSIVMMSGDGSLDLCNMAVSKFGILEDIDGWGEVKPTRVDLCVDMAFTSPFPKMLREMRQDKRLEEIQLEAGRDFRLIDGLSGDTLYFGKRNSPSYGRIYDKSEAYGMELGSVYRFEMESKKRVARPVFKSLFGTYEKFRNPDEGLRADIARIVRGQFLKWGVVLNVTDGIEIIRGEARHTTPDQQLEWLSRSVAPVVRKLRAMGYEQKTLEALTIGVSPF